ncbi:MAG: pimeloyl-ACP methyl ester esterase BioH [Gammaproteobacteria bacterium]|nr:pimeloyl-ACP methyl ester esterase BioH [Gammaproteobacteria bacterium]MCB1850497.1 pimeloyl-ACP methyl ester esterase BioH [Gammaproteobacteria bacterium]MCP5415863.1 pimeloyl-ACP methyl ester esterase BioH [Chromatiaceae bacterium]
MCLNAVTTGAGADLVLLHGWGMNNAVWSSLLPNLTQSFRVTLIELPGHGGSGYQEGGEKLDDWVQLCLAAAPSRAYWIGWSLGGQIAQRAALLAPERVSRLLLFCSTPRFVRADDWHNAMLAETLQQFAAALQKDQARTLARFLSLQVQGDELARDTLRLLHHEVVQQPAPVPLALVHGLALLLTVDLRDQLNRLPCPSCWILGEKDVLIPGSVVRDLALLGIPDARFELMKGCAHAPFISHTRASLALLKEFLGTTDE